MRNSNYWKFFNALGRVVGLLFLMVGLIMLIYGLTLLKNQQTDAWLIIIVSSVTAVLGIFVMVAKPYQSKDTESLK
jgi:cytochrome c biogenesis protein CcdA